MTDEPRPSYAPLVQVRRGPIPESEHFGAWAVATRQGNLVASLGDPDLLTYPRSALKPFQALALVESGGADAFSLTPRHLALACASHRAEPFQVELVREWLGRLDLAPEALACGPAWPSGEADRDARVAAGEAVSPLFHNCSGKHAGLLSVCRHCHYSVHDYAHEAHPLQEEIRRTIGALVERPIDTASLGVDGCNLPAIPLTLRETATAVARFAAGDGANAAQGGAMLRLLDAMRRHPDHMSGRGQDTEIVCEATEGRILVKTGAEGYLVAFLPAEQLGIAIKIADGSDRARFVVLVELLARLGLITPRESERLEALRRPTLTNSVGRPVGSLCACFADDVVDARKGRGL